MNYLDWNYMLTFAPYLGVKTNLQFIPFSNFPNQLVAIQMEIIHNNFPYY
jgi:hypothetical protein